MSVETLEELEAVPTGTVVEVTARTGPQRWTRTETGLEQGDLTLPLRSFIGAIADGEVAVVDADAAPTGHGYEIGQQIGTEAFIRLPEGTIIEGRGDHRRRVIGTDGMWRYEESVTWYETRDVGGYFHIRSFPAEETAPEEEPAPEEGPQFAVRQVINANQLRLLPVHTVIRGVTDQRERQIIDGDRYRTTTRGTVGALGSLYGRFRIVRLPEAPAEPAPTLPTETDGRDPARDPQPGDVWRRGGNSRVIHAVTAEQVRYVRFQATDTSARAVDTAHSYTLRRWRTDGPAARFGTFVPPNQRNLMERWAVSHYQQPGTGPDAPNTEAFATALEEWIVEHDDYYIDAELAGELRALMQDHGITTGERTVPVRVVVDGNGLLTGGTVTWRNTIDSTVTTTEPDPLDAITNEWVAEQLTQAGYTWASFTIAARSLR